MLQIPKWIIDFLEGDFRCPHCKSGFDPEYIIACGIRKSFQPRKKEQQILYLEYECKKCEKQRSLLELQEMNFEDFAYSILESEGESIAVTKMPDSKKETDPTSKKPKARKKKPDASKKSKITQKEIEADSQFLKGCSHSEFLRELGVIPEDPT